MSENGAKRIQAKDLRCKERQPLQEIVPLTAPFVVYIEPTNLCNFKCTFCPTSDKPLLKKVGRPGGLMPFELFCKIVDELKEFGQKVKLISLYKDGEPLVHKQFVDMVRYVKQADIAERVWTKTNAALLNPELNQQLVDAGLDMIHISVEGVSSEAYMDIAQAKIDYEKFRSNIADLYSRRGKMEMYVKICNAGLKPEEIAKFYEDFQPICTHIAVEELMGWSYSDIKDFTLGTKPDTYDGLPLIPKIACAYPFYVMAVNWNGRVSLCGNDWSHNTVVGDASKQTMKQIWESDELFEFRKMHLENRRSCNLACGECYYLQIVPDNIDDFRDEMLEKLKKARPAPAV